MIFTQLSNRQRASLLARWLPTFIRNLAKLAVGSKKRFLVMTPAILRKQLVYDRKSKKLISVMIRDLVDYAVIRHIFIDHDYSIEKSGRASDLSRVYNRIVSTGKTPLIVDCGGNSGMATRYYSETFPEARIVYIEPDEGNVSLARENNPQGDVEFLHAGVGNSDTTANLLDPGHGNWGYRVEEDVAGKTKIISINSILNSPAFADCLPFIAKIDIEGFEANLFERNTEWIDAFPLLVIELHDWMLPGQANSQNFLKEIAKRNRDFVFNGENVFSTSNSLM
jgi:FkbM family methyltransferase